MKGQVLARASVTASATESISDSASLRDQSEASFSLSTSPSGPDFFILDLAEKLENALPLELGDTIGSHALARLREEASEKALNSRWPTNKDEAYRFTDVRFLKNIEICPSRAQSLEAENEIAGNITILVDSHY